MGSGDPETMARMAEPDVLLDAIEDRVPDESELRDGLAELIFHGSLRDEFSYELNQEQAHGRSGAP